MISYYSIKEGKLIDLKGLERNCWVNITPPFDTKNLEILSEELGIPVDYLTDSLDIDEKSRFEDEESVKLIVCNTPVGNEQSDSQAKIPFITIPIGIIITNDIIITISSQKNQVLNYFLTTKDKNVNTENKNRFILQLFDKNVHFFMFYLRKINKLEEEYEQELYNSMKNKALRQLLNFEKSLVYFVTSLRSNELMMIKMQRTKFLDLTEEENDLLDDAIVDVSQALEMSNIYTNILGNSMDAFASIISNNLNMVMKRLTSVTIVLMVPTLIASFYGMNVKLPFQNSPIAFLLTVSFSIALSFIMFWFFMKKKWF